MEEALDFIDRTIQDSVISDNFVSELHKKVVDGLTPPPNGEGDLLPGFPRLTDIQIDRAAHLPPHPGFIKKYMDELVQFINQSNESKYDLLKIALAHHRFLWIHPFGNGNGRTVRLLTYAMLIKQGFRVDKGNRIINPTAVFCINRDRYYEFLSKADDGSDEGLLAWCEYVLNGLKGEIEKVNQLLDYEYLKNKILMPAIDFSSERRLITPIEAKVLNRAISRQIIQASDLRDLFQTKSPASRSVEISRQVRKLIDKKMLVPEEPGKRKYIISFSSNLLLRGIIQALSDDNFIFTKQ